MIKYVCSYCGYILYEYPSENWRRLLSPKEVAGMYGKCPRCGKKLEPVYDKTRVRVSLSTKRYKL